MVALAILALVATVVFARQPYTFHGDRLEPLRPAPDFALTDDENGIFRLRDQRGRVLLIFFGYTFCPDICPMALATLSRAEQLLGPEASRVRFVFITVDPERDTPARLQQYLSHLGPSFSGLSGDRQTLEQVWRDYGVHVAREEQPNSLAGYLVAHSTWTYLVDPEGNLRLVYPLDVSAEDLAEDVRALLKEK